MASLGSLEGQLDEWPCRPPLYQAFTQAWLFFTGKGAHLVLHLTCPRNPKQCLSHLVALVCAPGPLAGAGPSRPRTRRIRGARGSSGYGQRSCSLTMPCPVGSWENCVLSSSFTKESAAALLMSLGSFRLRQMLVYVLPRAALEMRWGCWSTTTMLIPSSRH